MLESAPNIMNFEIRIRNSFNIEAKTILAVGLHLYFDLLIVFSVVLKPQFISLCYLSNQKCLLHHLYTSQNSWKLFNLNIWCYFWGFILCLFKFLEYLSNIIPMHNIAAVFLICLSLNNQCSSSIIYSLRYLKN